MLVVLVLAVVLLRLDEVVVLVTVLLLELFPVRLELVWGSSLCDREVLGSVDTVVFAIVSRADVSFGREVSDGVLGFAVTECPRVSSRLLFGCLAFVDVGEGWTSARKS